ncbi:hypothetical protein [Mesobacillus thioparans]|uniref:hypothetical protein n=1 Tax=Mesobacillus thioparans TaxID=370439 RepID=UPI0039EEDC9D
MKVLSKFSLMVAIVALLTFGSLGLAAVEETVTEEKIAMDPGGVGHAITPETEVAYGTVSILADPGGVGH